MKYAGIGLAYQSFGWGRFRRGVDNGAVSDYVNLHYSDVRYPARMFAAMDSKWSTQTGKIGGYNRVTFTVSTSESCGNPDGIRHGGVLNMLYADGHAGALHVNALDPHQTLGRTWKYLQWNGWKDAF